MTEGELQPLVSRCPDCSTQFKVSEAQLQVANGKVRCGSCLAVFEGVDNLVWDSEFDSVKSADNTLDAVLDQLDDDAVLEPEQAEPASTPDVDLETGSDATLTQDQADRPALVTLEQLDEDYDWPLIVNKIVAAANADTGPKADFAVESIDVPAEEDLLDLGSNYIGPDYATLTRTPQQAPEQKQPSRNRREIMAEMHAAQAQREAEEAAAPIDENRIADTPASVSAVTQEDLQSENAQAYPKNDELEQVWERKPEPAKPKPTIDAPQTQAEPTGAAATVRNWRIPLMAGAVVLLIAQVMYLQFDDWAVNPTFRPAYAAACAVLPCDLPDRRDLDLLKSRALKVRSHPQEGGKLLVDALIVNEAEFDQPFPVLHLKFASVEGNPLDSERFTPADYLAGDMVGVKMMPARTPVHIEVIAIDPGTQAVSYTLDFE